MKKVIDIELGNICNYKCSYCHPASHSGNDWTEYNALIEFISYVKKDNDVYIILSGGEPTRHPQIKNILKSLNNMKCFVVLHTNGYKSVNWFLENIKYINQLIISYQPEFVNQSDFIKKLKEISKWIHVKVNISMMVEKYDECVEVYNIISKIKNTTIVLKALKNKKTNKLYTYTEEQLNQMAETTNEQKIITTNKNIYKGWKCWKGVDLLKIIANNDYYLATCDMKHKKKYGNIKDRPIKLPTEPTTCEYDSCFCVSDLKCIRKENQ